MKITAYLQSLVTVALLFAISVTFAIDTTFIATNPSKKGVRNLSHGSRVLQNIAPVSELARNKPAFQSSLKNNHKARNAVDGRLGHGGQGPSMTKLESDPWWYVDLEDDYEIEQIIITNSATMGSRTEGFRVEIEQENTLTGDYHATFTYDDSSGATTDGQVFTITVDPIIVGRRVKVSLPGKYTPLNLGEVQVYGRSISPVSPTISPTTSPTAPYVKGDPHFMTWNGKTYDFHGVCDLVLASVATFGKGIGMDIHIRSKRMRMWSFVSSVAVRIGQEIFEVTGGGKAIFLTNGVEGKPKSKEGGISLVSTISGFPIHWIYESGKGEKFNINLGNNEKIAIGTWHSFVSVSFENARSETFKGSVGLLGSFSDGSKLARDGTTIISGLNKYGQEWQVRDSEPKLFHTKEGPQYPSKCNIPSSTEMRRRLGKSELTTNDAKNACINVNETEMELCIFDVLATSNKFTAGAYSI